MVESASKHLSHFGDQKSREAGKSFRQNAQDLNDMILGEGEENVMR